MGTKTEQKNPPKWCNWLQDHHDLIANQCTHNTVFHSKVV